MQLKLKLPNAEPDLWDQFDQEAQQQLLNALSKILGKTVNQTNESERKENRSASEARNDE